MKRTLLTLLTVIVLAVGFAQTAVNFTVDNCNGVNYDLFTELDAGKVVVITWVMPCGSCIPAALTAYNTVTGLENSNVVFYLCDDYGNTSCSTISSWAATNGINTKLKFSNSAIDMTEYGTVGMPKTVVLGGGSCHTVFFNENGTVSQSTLETAINDALTPCDNGITEQQNSGIGLSVFPNPATSSVTAKYALTTSTEVTIEILNILGEKVQTISLGRQSAGENEYAINLETFSAGIYSIQLNTEKEVETVNVTVSR